MPPPTEAGPVPVELGPLRELLAVDRRGAGESRTQPARRELTTVAYSMPLHVQWRRALRRHRRLRIAAWSIGLSFATMIALWQAPLLVAQWEGAVGWAEHATGIAPRLWFHGAVSWTQRATGMAPRLWLHALSADELRASERGPAP